MPDANEPLLDAAQAAFIQSGVGLGIAASSADAVPVHVRAIGCKVTPDRSEVTVFVSSSQAAPLLECMGEDCILAAVFTHPVSHRTLQLKGRRSRVAPGTPEDLRIVEAYRDAFCATLVPLGFDEKLIRTLLACAPADIVGISLVPTEAYSQTPGPKAGERLGRSA